MSRAPSSVLFATLLTAGVLSTAGAQGADTVAHVVQRGESLYRIAQEQLEEPSRWPELARLNRIARPSRLQPGQRLLLPLALMKGQASPATVAYVRGGVLADGVALRIGDRIAEAATLTVPAQGFISVTLADGSLLQLQSGSVARLVRLRELPRETRNTLIELDRGRIDLRVSPQTPGSRFRVRTPLATAGVRGTRFGVTMPA
ncbi:FecR domain-containing protein, partial [Mitsuaria sp. TWR114]|uniref:FecR domain-containing protein n=1 Tax=Mitsuaria sp. TWR114 TaxID=2601731 RepID=UPI002102202D